MNKCLMETEINTHLTSISKGDCNWVSAELTVYDDFFLSTNNLTYFFEWILDNLNDKDESWLLPELVIVSELPITTLVRALFNNENIKKSNVIMVLKDKFFADPANRYFIEWQIEDEICNRYF